ncbi:hypothetical protein ACLMJK_004690 [Lecanora helva]
MADEKRTRIVELLSTDSINKSRADKVRCFQLQAWTAVLCLVTRTALLCAYAMCIVRAKKKQAPTLDDNDASYLVAYAFLFMETMFSCKLRVFINVRPRTDRVQVHRLYPQHIQSIQHGAKARFRPRLQIKGDQVPTIDVFIFYCGEEVDVLLDTVRAACSLDYPLDRLRIVVLDDSNAVQAQVDALRTHYTNLLYSARERKDRAWHKAGNINHGLSFMNSLPRGPGEFVAGLDVDMIADKDWLRRLVPHLIRDAKVGLVSPNQRFYNVPRGDYLGQLLQYDQLQDIRQIRRDFGNEGWGAGSRWVVRRTALDAIGGFSTDGIAEDFLTCVDLRDAGWDVILVDENVQWGLIPDSFNGHTKLYAKWMAVVFSFYRSLVSSGRPRHQKVVKIVAESSVLAYVVAMSVCYFILPLMSLSGHPFVLVQDQKSIKILISLAFVDFAAQSMHGFLESAAASFIIYSWHEPSHLWHTPLFILPALRRWFPGLTQVFLGKEAAHLTGGNPSSRSTEDSSTSPWERLKIIVFQCQVTPHIIVLILCFAGMTNFSLTILRRRENEQNLLDFIVTHAGWPPAFFLWTSTLKNACKPFYYALFVSPRLPREAHLLRDEKTGVASPTPESKDQIRRRVSEWHLCAILVYFSCIVAVYWQL